MQHIKHGHTINILSPDNSANKQRHHFYVHA